MADASNDMIAFYSSVTGLPFIVLLVTVLVALGAIIGFFLQYRLLRRYQADVAWQNQQIGKRLQALQEL